MKGLVLADTLAAVALSEYCDKVIIVERDRIPSGPEPRKGVPQGRHVHNLMPSGARAIDDLLPGTIDALVAAGGQRIDVPRRLVSIAFGVWNHRYPSNQMFVSASRPLLDSVVRQQALASDRIEYVERADVIGLTGGTGKVTGALVRDRETRRERELTGDFVVDAMGRSSGTPGWLAELGLPAVDRRGHRPGCDRAGPRPLSRRAHRHLGSVLSRPRGRGRHRAQGDQADCAADDHRGLLAGHRSGFDDRFAVAHGARGRVRPSFETGRLALHGPSGARRDL